MDCYRQYWMVAFICLTVFMAPFTRADETLLTDDGREVRLHDDGSWEFISNDRYANTPDGRRIRLRDNYTWEYLGNAPLATKKQFRTTTTDLRLVSMLIKATEEKVHKNKRVISRTYLALDISRSPLAEQPLHVDQRALEQLTLTDNKGRRYPAMFMKPRQITVAPGETQRLIIVFDDSPQWWSGAKSMSLSIEPGVFGNRKPVNLTERISDIDKIIVERFD